MLEFEINGQRLRLKGNLYVVAESIDYLKARFAFSADWDGAAKTAIFKTADRKGVYNVILDENGICTVPSEVIHAPRFYVSVFGGSRITANEVEVQCNVSGYAEGSAPDTPTPEIYEQILAEINKKVSKVDGMGLSENSYTTEEKTKLSGIAEGAEVNVQSDWSQTNADADDYIKNKPTKLSQFENDSGYTTSADLSGLSSGLSQGITNVSNALSNHQTATVLPHADGSVTTAKLADGSVTKEKIAKDVIPTSLPASDVYDWAKQSKKPTYTAAEVGALPSDTEIPSYSAATQSKDGLMSAADKKKLDGLSEGGGGGITEETDPTVPDWAKQSEKPKYTAAEVGADSSGSAASAFSDAKTYIDEKVKTNVPENALFTDTVYDDTEIKTALNRKLDKSGGNMTGTLVVDTTVGGNHNEGIRINKNAQDQWSMLHLGGDVNSQSGTNTGEWTIARNNQGKLIIAENGYTDDAGLTATGDSMKWKGNEIITSKGGTMNTGATIKFTTNIDDRSNEYGLIPIHNISTTSYWASYAMTHITQDASKTDFGGFGAYGEPNALEYFYVGSYDNPLFKIMQANGNTTVKGSLTAPTFVGKLTGNADTATKATQDSEGNNIVDTYATKTELNTKAPTSHASTATTYGIGTSSNYGHVKLSDSTSTTSGASAGVAATPTAVKAAYDKANIKKNPDATDGDMIVGHLTVGQRGGNIGEYSFVTGGLVDDIDTCPNIASGNRSASICGKNNTASGQYSAVLGGYQHTASGHYSAVLGGYHNTASGHYSAVLGGNQNTASGQYSAVLGGYQNTASGNSGIAMGNNNTALAYQTKMGRYATEGTAGSSSGTTGDALTVGIGTSSAAKNGFRVDYSGNGYFYKAVSGTGADYAEMWEWQDGNPNSADRVGYFVAFDGDKIRFANENDDLRKVGIISGKPAVIGDNFADDWQGMYLQDIYGRNITEHKSYDAEYDAEGNLIHEAYEADEFILNPDYNPDEKYIPRQQRKEWDAVGTHGKLVVRDDGTCQVDGYCRPTDGGIATASEDGFYVMERINDTHIRVYLR